MRFLLVHTPAVGPATWRWVADALRSRGHEAVVPNLVAAALTGEPAAFAQAAVQAVDAEEDTVICGHSAVGGVLPAVARLVLGVRRVVFIDASVPPCEGPASAGGEFLGALRGLAADGVLPVWSRWWGEGVLEVLGWPVVERQGAHLDLANDEEAIAEILVGLAERP